MCWNENISLNTFIFGTAVLIFIYYNNKYTQYKIDSFQNIYTYILFISIISMQLIEYFLWKSINQKNQSMNYWWSIIGYLTVSIAQPISFLLMLPNKYNLLRNKIISIYLLILSLNSIYKYKYNLFNFETTVKNGHLYWNWMSDCVSSDYIISTLYFIFILALYNVFPVILVLLLLQFGYLYVYKNANWGSLWCWSFNLFFLYYLCKILFIAPFNEYNGLC
jgi:hypothetical protein